VINSICFISKVLYFIASFIYVNYLSPSMLFLMGLYEIYRFYYLLQLNYSDFTEGFLSIDDFV